MKQQTINQSFSLNGKGLHSGLQLNITFHPAPDNYGYRIRRTDIAGQPIIRALAENVGNTERGTVLSEKGATVSTVEHALAALYASEIDNCLMDINGPEFPILDGSAILYVKRIRQIGIKQQQSERKYISFDAPITINNPATGSEITLLPDINFEVKSTIDFDSPVLPKQTVELKKLSDFATQFAQARTFVFVREIETLLKHNLIKGGDLDNAIVIYDKKLPQEEYDKIVELTKAPQDKAFQIGFIMNKPLSSLDEPARHKLLDLLGDIALVGGFIHGKIIATRPGHTINTNIAKAIRAKYLSTQKNIQLVHELDQIN